MPNIGSAPKGKNFETGLIVQSSTGVRTDPMVELYADPTSHRLLVDANITIDNIVLEAGGIYNVTAPTLVDGQQGELQLDSHGNLLVSNIYATTVTTTFNSNSIVESYSAPVSKTVTTTFNTDGSITTTVA